MERRRDGQRGGSGQRVREKKLGQFSEEEPPLSW